MSILLIRYRIKRTHSNRTGPFVVNVPEARQRGVGFQFKWRDWVFGASLIFDARHP